MKRDILKMLGSKLESQCNRYVNGECTTRACLARGGWKRGMPVDPDLATCKYHEQAVALRELQAEVERLARQLGDILAVIHRDGGHHTAAVGIEQSVNDAHQRWAELMTEIERLKQENHTQRTQLQARFGYR